MTSTKRVSLVTRKYTGQIEEPSTLQTLLRSDLSNKRIPVTHIFIAHYHAYPCTVLIQASSNSAKLHVPTIRRYLEIDHKHNSTHDIVKREYHPIAHSLYITDFLADLDNGIMLDCENCQLINDIDNPNKYKSDGPHDHFLIVEKVRISYLPQHEIYVNGELASKLASFYILQLKLTTIQVVCKYPQEGYYLNEIDIKKPFIYDLSLNYGKDFLIIHHQILKKLSLLQWKGLILLSGILGTGKDLTQYPFISAIINKGKTYYIRYLINELSEKNFIYFPSDIMHDLSSSEFLQILKAYSHSIIIIDDAENINKDHPHEALNHLINLYHHLSFSPCKCCLISSRNHLSHQPIIAVFNSHVSQTLSHLKNPPIIQHSFDKLDITTTRLILKTLGSQRNSETIQQPMTLAEIYTQITHNEPTKKLKTPDEMIQSLAEQELSLSDKENCILS